jgi:hypothetical protein
VEPDVEVAHVRVGVDMLVEMERIVVDGPGHRNEAKADACVRSDIDRKGDLGHAQQSDPSEEQASPQPAVELRPETT